MKLANPFYIYTNKKSDILRVVSVINNSPYMKIENIKSRHIEKDVYYYYIYVRWIEEKEAYNTIIKELKPYLSYLKLLERTPIHEIWEIEGFKL